ncbi:methyltransferase domain-containing protein [Prochlorococcus marinus]|uniref:methyltransferase domain-containing protein n=1 Tax=Prochlorococcus marinus TaxID=1219 RepID=UPI001AD9A3EA|nr:methyltransferase domain-containing protein [Prochlorococcus marinus]MBO8204932.1 methyltransferase domain-containing protein [Prochlorococcus marinus CUG1415]MBW3044204.1 methyltransferase [Prochlorococcus marinus str. MU1415]
MSYQQNQAGDNIKTDVSSWSFEGDTAKSFEAHISKSVPGYQEGQSLIASYSDFFINLTPQKIYDLGCSTGSLLEKIEARHPKKPINYVGFDIVPKMIEIAKKKKFINPERFKFECKDILSLELSEASIITSYYTLQFILPSVRQDLVNKIYDSLAWGGAFFIFEKTRGPDGRFQDMNSHVYNEYKLRQGYKPEEIFSKSRSLAGVLEPFSDKGNYDMFQRAGFKDIEYIYTNISFKGWMCIK